MTKFDCTSFKLSKNHIFNSHSWFKVVYFPVVDKLRTNKEYWNIQKYFRKRLTIWRLLKVLRTQQIASEILPIILEDVDIKSFEVIYCFRLYLLYVKQLSVTEIQIRLTWYLGLDSNQFWDFFQLNRKILNSL